MRILLIEDNVGLAEELKDILTGIGFAVDIVYDGNVASYQGRTTEYDLIIADISIPEKRGNIVVEEIRKSGKECPILMMSGVSDTAMKANLLREYADDYLTKPFDVREFLARIQALLRRPRSRVPALLQIGGVVLDIDKGAMKLEGEDVYLTRKEFSLLHYLMRHADVPLTRQHLLEHVWDINTDPFSNTVEMHIRNLRKKIGYRYIRTVPGMGYKFTAR